MGYIHKGCGGGVRWYGVLPIPPKCKKCGKVWSPFVIYGPPRKDMYFEAPRYRGPKIKVKKGSTSYAGWGDKVPGVGLVASRLPNWPRWARLLSTGLLVLGLAFCIYWLFIR